MTGFQHSVARQITTKQQNPYDNNICLIKKSYSRISHQTGKFYVDKVIKYGMNMHQSL